MTAVASRSLSEQAIVTASIGSPTDLDDLIARAVGVAGEERPFALLLTIRGLALADHCSSFAAIRRLPGGRAYFGTWCRAVGYVFETADDEEAAHRHLHEAPLLWGTRILTTREGKNAAAWLRAELRRFDGAAS